MIDPVTSVAFAATQTWKSGIPACTEKSSVSDLSGTDGRNHAEAPSVLHTLGHWPPASVPVVLSQVGTSVPDDV